MGVLFSEPSHTFNEYLLIPNLTGKNNVSENISLKTSIVRYRKNGDSPLKLNIPFCSAIMQSVSNHNMGIALARSGGISLIFVSQPIEEQVRMVEKVKKFKAGFFKSNATAAPEKTLKDVLELCKKTGHTTVPVTEDGTSRGRFLGMLTSRDYRIGHTDLDIPVRKIMTPIESVVFGKDGISLKDANDLIWEHKLNTLPILSEDRKLQYLVFRKDYDQHRENPDELIDAEKRLVVGAGINTRDFKERAPALIEAGADILCIDSSDGYCEWQSDTIKWIKNNSGENVYIGAGNVIDPEGFRYLADAGADFIKVGIGGGSICITREQKGIGRGQATAVMEVAKARDEYFKKTGIYIPICSDGGIVHDYHIVLALAMGADFVMMGRYFARFDESPSKRIKKNGSFVKEYWGEGANRARNWERYSDNGDGRLKFEEGVDGYVPYAGKLKDNLLPTIEKIKSTMINCGANTIKELREKARITLVSATTLREGSAHDITLKDSEYSPAP